MIRRIGSKDEEGEGKSSSLAASETLCRTWHTSIGRLDFICSIYPLTYIDEVFLAMFLRSY